MGNTFKGTNGQFEILEDEVLVSKTGMFSKKIKGEERLPLQAISGVLLHPALPTGWLQVAVHGGPLNTTEASTAMRESKTVMFRKPDQPQFSELANWLDQVAGQNRASGKWGTLSGASAGPAGELLFSGMSHEGGRNARVTLYADRIERVKEKSFGSLQRARQDTEVTPTRSVTSVQVKKDGLLYSKVTAYASGNNIEFRFGHAEAQQFSEAIQSVILGGGPAPAAMAPSVAPPAPQEPDLLQRLRQLGDLRDDGVLTDAESQAKKTDLLSRL